MASLRRKLIRALEDAGMTGLLAAFGTVMARRATGRDVELLYDEIWIRRVGDEYYGDKEKFDYYVNEFRSWNYLHDLWRSDPVDCWLYDYRPEAGDIVVDVGAGFGNDAVVFSRAVGPTGRVIAIEAHPVAFRRLQKTCKWTKLENVTPVWVALDENNGEAWISGDADSVSSSIGGFSPEETARHRVPARRFDDLARELGLGDISFLKMNIEGAEKSALKGMPETLKRVKRAAIACHDFRTRRGESDYFTTKAFVMSTLTDAGFEVTTRDDDPRPYVADTLYGRRAKQAD